MQCCAVCLTKWNQDASTTTSLCLSNNSKDNIEYNHCRVLSSKHQYVVIPPIDNIGVVLPKTAQYDNITWTPALKTSMSLHYSALGIQTHTFKHHIYFTLTVVSLNYGYTEIDVYSARASLFTSTTKHVFLGVRGQTSIQSHSHPCFFQFRYNPCIALEGAEQQMQEHGKSCPTCVRPRRRIGRRVAVGGN